MVNSEHAELSSEPVAPDSTTTSPEPLIVEVPLVDNAPNTFNVVELERVEL